MGGGATPPSIDHGVHRPVPFQKKGQKLEQNAERKRCGGVCVARGAFVVAGAQGLQLTNKKRVNHNHSRLAAGNGQSGARLNCQVFDWIRERAEMSGEAADQSTEERIDPLSDLYSESLRRLVNFPCCIWCSVYGDAEMKS
jgi:hypothetical protein